MCISFSFAQEVNMANTQGLYVSGSSGVNLGGYWALWGPTLQCFFGCCLCCEYKKKSGSNPKMLFVHSGQN